MAYEQIVLARNDGIAEITLNRPERLNAYTSQMGRELHEAFAACDADDAVRAIIVTGAGRGFCAGADLSPGGPLERPETAPDPARPWARAPHAIRPWEVRKPIIAAINGAAVGIGATLPLQWDVRMAAESARIGFAFVRRGVVPEALSTWILPRLIGLARATEVLLSGRLLSAAEALALGIVSRVVPDAELLPTVRAFAAEIARESAPVSVAITKHLLWHMQTEDDLGAAEELEAHSFWWTTQQPDAREGIQAFRDKRPPRWSMRPSADMPNFLPPSGRRR
jgi:enoyl-CoA hydratase/carnithine racemase